MEEFLKNNVIRHYDCLIDEDNDPVRDPEPLKAYMDKWDGQGFIDKMQLSRSSSVLEIGVGTGRLAIRTAPQCKKFYGIDVSPKTIDRAKENLVQYKNVTLICGDFLYYRFECTFDVVYSSLTFMHIEDKQRALRKVSELLNRGGRFVLSIDKNPSEFIDVGTYKVKIYPDNADETAGCIEAAGLTVSERYDTEFAAIFIAVKI